MRPDGAKLTFTSVAPASILLQTTSSRACERLLTMTSERSFSTVWADSCLIWATTIKIVCDVRGSQHHLDLYNSLGQFLNRWNKLEQNFHISSLPRFCMLEFSSSPPLGFRSTGAASCGRVLKTHRFLKQRRYLVYYECREGFKSAVTGIWAQEGRIRGLHKARASQG